MLESSESFPSELSLLPAASPLHRLRYITIDLAKRLDGFLGNLEDTKGYGSIHIEVRRGELRELDVTRKLRFDI